MGEREKERKRERKRERKKERIARERRMGLKRFILYVPLQYDGEQGTNESAPDAPKLNP